MKLPPTIESWYAGLAPRERRLVIAGGIALAVMLVYLAVVSPIMTAHSSLVNDVRQKRELLALINRSAPQLRGNNAGLGHLRPGESVFAATSSSIQSSGISGAVQRLEQSSDGGVRLSLSNVNFNALVRWLSGISRTEGIVVTHANIEQSNNPGTVNARLTLNTASSSTAS